eukprot:4022759-Prymnesium_polylepis.1
MAGSNGCKAQNSNGSGSARHSIAVTSPANALHPPKSAKVAAAMPEARRGSMRTVTGRRHANLSGLIAAARAEKQRKVAVESNSNATDVHTAASPPCVSSPWLAAWPSSCATRAKPAPIPGSAMSSTRCTCCTASRRSCE